MKTQSTLCPATATSPPNVAGPKKNPSSSCKNTTISFLSVPDSVLEHDMLSFLPPHDSAQIGFTHRDFNAPALHRLSRREIRVPEDCTSINEALAEVSFLVNHCSPHGIPDISLGPGKHVLKGGLLTICDSHVTIRGRSDPFAGTSTSSQIIGRIRIEAGAQNVTLKSLSVSNPFGAGVWVTGKGTQVELHSCKISNCRGDGVYARQGSSCVLISCDVNENKSSGVAAWDDMTAFKIFDTNVSKNQGDGVKVFPGALVDVSKSRVRRNSGHGLVTSDESSSINIFESCIIDNACGEFQGQVNIRRERSVTV
eukprot:g4976.t1